MERQLQENKQYVFRRPKSPEYVFRRPKSPEIFGFNCSENYRFLWLNDTSDLRKKLDN